MNASSLPALYNQRSQSDEEFVAHFVARRDLLKTLLRRLQTAEPDGMGPHQILIGPRGMGKTSLLRRIAIAINCEPDLSTRFVPLSFREEQYNVLTLGDFWRNCGESLAEWAEATGRPALASRIDLALPSSAWATEEAAGSQFHREMAALQRQAVLLVDNLNLILDALPSESAWILRRHLQARQGPILIGAATQPLTQAADSKAAFYEFFHPVYLEPLSEPETEHCMRVLAKSGGAHGAQVLRVLDAQPERLKTLHTLTGGNPRVLALIYRLLGTGESQAAMADLELLLDQVTPFYKARIEDYESAQQRAAIDAIALHWDPIETSALARLTGIAATTLSPLLIRLRKDGLIEQVDLSGSYAGHQLVERFLNIWYLMRHGTRRVKQKMRWLVAFLTSFYSFHELTEIANRTPDRGMWHRDYRFAFDEALQRAKGPGLLHEPIALRELSRPEQTISATTGTEDRRSLVAAPYPGEGRAVSASRQDPPASPGSPVALATERVQLANSLNLGMDRSAALAIYEDVLTRFPNPTDPGLQEQVIRALNGKAIALANSGDSSAALGLYDDLLARFADAPEPALREQVARALLNKAITLGEAGDSAAAIALYDDLLARFADAPEPALREQVARALLNKAFTLGQAGDSAAAIALYDDLLARFADAPEPALREQVAGALFNKAITLRQAGDSAAEIALYDDLLARFADAPEPALREQVAGALFNKAITLRQAGDSAAAIALYDDLLARFADAPEPALREPVARALFNKAFTLGRAGDSAAAIALYDDLLARFADAPEPALREQVARALLNKAFRLGQAGDSAAEIALCDDLLARFADAPEPALREQVARALLSKAFTLGQAGDSAAEIALYDDLLTRFADAPEPALREQVAGALLSKAITLRQAGDSAAAIMLYDDLLARFADAPEPALREPVAGALLSKAITLGEAGDSAAEIALYDDLLARFADAPEPALREPVARALLNKAFTLGRAGDSAAAIALYDDLLARFADAPEPALREPVAGALFNKAFTLRQAGDSAAAIALYDDLLARFADAPEPALREQVARAQISLGSLLLDSRADLVRPEALYRDAAVAKPDVAHANLAWFYLLANRLEDAVRMRQTLETIPAPGLALLDAGIELAKQNFGAAIAVLPAALDANLEAGNWTFADDLNRLLRLADYNGFGERLIGWFETTGFADRLAPVYIAFKAYVRTEKLLLDVNPEVRRPARAIYDRLDAPRRHAAGRLAPQPRRRGRKRSRTS